MGNFLLDLFFPPKCVFCGRLLQKHERDFCTSCLYEMPESSRCAAIKFTNGCIAPLRYTGIAKDAIKRYKFSGKSCYAAAFGRLICKRIGQTNAQIVTWIPVSSRRRAKRGYDQSQLLAKEVAAHFGLPCVCLLRKRHTPKQSTMSGLAERTANVSGAFHVIHPEKIIEKHILLIDDVCTTGATLTEASRILKTAGAEQITCAALAMTEQ